MLELLHFFEACVLLRYHYGYKEGHKLNAFGDFLWM